MELKLFPTAGEVAAAAAAFIAAEARSAVGQRGVFNLAVSGGKTPWLMLGALSDEDVPWQQVHVFQVDERIAPDGDPERNLTHLRESLRAPIPPAHLHPMPVGDPDPEAAARDYAATLAALAGSTLDLVHLGLGADGHTASLVPGDPVLDLTDRDVAITGPYQHRRRMTLTYPAINRARRILFVVTGADKSTALHKLRDRDPSIPATHIRHDNASLFTDTAAA